MTASAQSVGPIDDVTWKKEAGFNATRAERMAKYGLPRNFAAIAVIRPSKEEADRLAGVLESTLAAIDEARRHEDRHFLPSYTVDLLNVYQLNAWPIPASLVRTVAALTDVEGAMAATARFTEKKAIEKALAIDLAAEIIADRPRHIPLYKFASEICRRARDDLGMPGYYISDRTLSTMKGQLKAVGWLELDRSKTVAPRAKPTARSAATAPTPATDRKRPTLPTSLDPALSRLRRHPK
ncbi:hypothetical protein I6F36_05805 [Bradyrhizobium sp. BRP19]|uniref:hypothetical protein n=1 Tax=Bradyrhizobium sp. BRP19 TaxID=2793823 RepID=UPI001CD6F74A|nr:hypothetical protein [Bradyrhizobium sp. BRP19]MCA1546318.1 hypothetical protein [Bradyrhizobium sp. BRP19]